MIITFVLRKNIQMYISSLSLQWLSENKFPEEAEKFPDKMRILNHKLAHYTISIKVPYHIPGLAAL